MVMKRQGNVAHNFSCEMQLKKNALQDHHFDQINDSGFSPTIAATYTFVPLN